MNAPIETKQARAGDARLTRIRAFDARKTAVLVVDVQNAEIVPRYERERPEYWRAVHERALPNQKRVIDAARAAGAEIVYTVIESLTADGRDRSLDHKLSEIFVPKGSPLARVIPLVEPQADDIVLPKTSSGVFNSTNLDYVLRNIGIESVVVVGFVTDQCVDMAIRDGADRGYYMVCVGDACAAYTDDAHRNALRAFGGYCRHMNADEFVASIG
ncbi:isochorismatase [Burkholderia sp. ABCPW 14]|uniref:cysteine hydrolase family protein n=1 Tax=Burkholderia sp. ABCPW 14 TaxID=1637860 RepID=UPI000770E344|nr:isochorismatase family cysteine hydrolase [Burkholderia sp. ABCPW 14]KVD74087.1 isochorismatase [Burkholderia sp. ABCPW 14]